MQTQTKPTFTPGPWRVGDAGNTVFGPPNGQPAPQTIADVRKGNKANARLIAKAPELYAMIRTVAHWMPSREPEQTAIETALDRVIYDARNLLAEIEGA